MTRAMLQIIGYWIVFIALGTAVAALPTTPWWWALWIAYGLWGCIYVYYEKVYSKLSVIFYMFAWPVLWLDIAVMSRGWTLFGMTPSTMNTLEILAAVVVLIVFLVYKLRERPESPNSPQQQSTGSR